MINDHVNATEVVYCFNHTNGKNINTFKARFLSFLLTQEILLLDTGSRTPSKMKSGKILSYIRFVPTQFPLPNCGYCSWLEFRPSVLLLSVPQLHPQRPSSAQQSGTNAPVPARSNQQDKFRAALPEPDPLNLIGLCSSDTLCAAAHISR